MILPNPCVVSFHAKSRLCSTFHAVSQFTGPYAQMIVPQHTQFVSLMPKCLVIISTDCPESGCLCLFIGNILILYHPMEVVLGLVIKCVL